MNAINHVNWSDYVNHAFICIVFPLLTDCGLDDVIHTSRWGLKMSHGALKLKSFTYRSWCMHSCFRKQGYPQWIIASHLISAKPLWEPRIDYRSLDRWEQILMKLASIYMNFLRRKWIRKYWPKVLMHLRIIILINDFNGIRGWRPLLPDTREKQLTKWVYSTNWPNWVICPFQMW